MVDALSRGVVERADMEQKSLALNSAPVCVGLISLSHRLQSILKEHNEALASCARSAFLCCMMLCMRGRVVFKVSHPASNRFRVIVMCFHARYHCNCADAPLSLREQFHGLSY